jgi:hypothetical protein
VVLGFDVTMIPDSRERELDSKNNQSFLSFLPFIRPVLKLPTKYETLY